MELTWRQASKWSLASGCGNYRIAKAKTHDGFGYLPYVLIDGKWQLITRVKKTADEAKEECIRWSESNSAR